MTAIIQPNLTIRRGRPSIEAMTTLGKMIQTRRGELGLTLAALSERSGLLPQTINAIERGASRCPRYATIHSLATSLEMPVTELAEAAYAEAIPA